MRLSIPDRPGSLGTVATAIGSVGGDICSMEIVERSEGRVIDDLLVALPDGIFPDALVSAVQVLDEVHVLWIARFPGGSLASDVQVLDEIIQHPDDAAQILVDSIPAVFHTNWSLLLDTDQSQVIARSEFAPDVAASDLQVIGDLTVAGLVELEMDWLPAWPQTTLAVCPIRSDVTLLTARHGGPKFLDSELARLQHLATLSGR